MVSQDDPYDSVAWKVVSRFSLPQLKHLLKNDNALAEWLTEEFMEQDYQGLFMDLALEELTPTQIPFVLKNPFRAVADTLAKQVDIEKLRNAILEVYSELSNKTSYN